MIILGIKQGGEKRVKPARLMSSISAFAVFVVVGQICGGLLFVPTVGVAHAENLQQPSRGIISTAYAGPVQAAPRNAEDEYRVQAVLSPKRRAVVSSATEGKIVKFNFNNGDVFEKGDVLVQYDCAVDYGRLKEAQARQRSSEAQLHAFEKLKKLESASQIELMMAREANEQNKAQVDQIRGRVQFCKVVAPFDGRVTNKMASLYEYVQTGRVLMDISSSDALRAQFLVPSKWLQWLNVGTAVSVHINESDRDYSARIVAIHGEVDPVSQTVEIAAEMESYHEELLPGMSGMATFNPETARSGLENGFLGLMLKVDWDNGNEKK